MKKRIISLTITVAMLFSFLSMNIFAEEQTSDCAGGNAEHSYQEISHEHDTVKGLNYITSACQICGDTKLTESEMTATSFPAGKVLTTAEISALAGANTIASVDQDTHRVFDYISRMNNRNPNAIVEFTDEATGNKYIKYVVNSTGGDGGTSFLNKNIDGFNSYAGVMQKSSEWGRSYVVSVDFAHYGYAEIKPFMIGSYLAGNNNTGNTIPNRVWNIEPISISPDGTLNYYNANVWRYNPIVNNGETVKLNAGQFYTITIHHIPMTNSISIYIDGECVLNNVYAINPDDTTVLSWTASDGTYVDMGKYFSPGYIRLCTMQNSLVAPETTDYLAYDNIKMYYSDVNYECSHSYVGTVCEWCGKVEAPITHCDLCDGEAISAGAAVVGRSASLGELIDMNVYMKLSEKLITTVGAKVILTAGDRTAEYTLADAVKDEDGKYRFPIALRSTQMSENVVVSLIGEESATYSTSIKSYAEDLIATSADEKAVATAKSMLNYGAAAQIYFAEKNFDPALTAILANAGLAEADKALKDVSASDFSAYSFKAAADTSDIQFTAISLVLSSKTYIKLYFTAGADAEVKVNGKTYTKTAYGNEYYITIAVNTPSLADDAFEVSIKDGEASVTGLVSAFSAVHAGLINTSTNPNLVTLLKAYAEFCDFAAAYAVN